MNESKFFDFETAKVWFAAIFSAGVTIVQLNQILTTVVLIGTAVYTWRKALRKRKKGDDDL